MSGEPPRVIKQSAQAVTRGGRKAEQKVREKERVSREDAARKAREALLPARPELTAQEISFYGHNIRGEGRYIKALAGQGAPTVTGGYAKVATVPRFQRVYITVPEGYDPIVLSIPIQFEAVAITRERPDIEAEILDLEWMAGRYPTKGEISGEPPLVEIYTVNSRVGSQTNLVPKQFQTGPERSQQWYITDIAWDANPLRGEGGERLRQAATVKLTEVMASPSARARYLKHDQALKGKPEIVYSSQAAWNIKKIAARERHPGSWPKILKANRNLGTNAEKRLKPGTKVKIPLEIYNEAPR